MEETGNSIHLRGHVCQPLQFGHELFGEQFFVTTLRVPRLSGAEDFLPITLSERLLIDRTHCRREHPVSGRPASQL
ncbi:MAG: hypothetical protein ACLUE8_00365 [Lachnospiraceae bacterium]